MKKRSVLLALMNVALMCEAGVVTQINQSPGLGDNIDLTAGSYITWG